MAYVQLVVGVAVCLLLAWRLPCKLPACITLAADAVEGDRGRIERVLAEPVKS